MTLLLIAFFLYLIGLSAPSLKVLANSAVVPGFGNRA